MPYKELQNIEILDITPEKILQKKSAKGKPFLSIACNKIWYQCWEPKAFHYFVEGQPITVQVTEDGKWKTIVGVENELPADKKEVKEDIKSPNDEYWQKIRDEKADNINHLNARTAAVEIVKESIRLGG